MTTPQSAISLRPAAPVFDDGLAFARLLDIAQEGTYRWKLGRAAGDVIAQAFYRPGHDLSYEYVTFAEHEGSIVGAASGYTGEAHRAHTHEPIHVAAGRRRRRLAVFESLAKRTLRFMDVVPDGDFYVRALAVDPAYRSRGIGTQLLSSLEAAAQAAGSQRLVLDVAMKNRRGRELYARLGMTIDSESPRFLGLPRTNIARMAKSLP